MISTTLRLIKAAGPCGQRPGYFAGKQELTGWLKLLNFLGKTEADDEPLSFDTILESNGLPEALWCARTRPDRVDTWRAYGAWCVGEQSQFLTPGGAHILAELNRPLLDEELGHTRHMLARLHSDALELRKYLNREGLIKAAVRTQPHAEWYIGEDAAIEFSTLALASALVALTRASASYTAGDAVYYAVEAAEYGAATRAAYRAKFLEVVG